MTFAPFAYRRGYFLARISGCAHDIARWLKRALFADSAVCATKTKASRRREIRSVAVVSARICWLQSMAGVRRINPTDRSSPSTTRNSARTIAVAPQISSSPTRNAGTVDAVALALAFRHDHGAPGHQRVDGHFEDARHLAVGRHERGRPIARADHRVQPEPAHRDVDRRERPENLDIARPAARFPRAPRATPPARTLRRAR